MIIDSEAEALENAGLYRRAATRWLEVFKKGKCDKEWEWIKQRRNECLRKKTRPPQQRDNFKDVLKAANETQEKMGIARPKGNAFRIKLKTLNQ